MSDCNIPGQIENRNFLYPTQFKLVLTRTPKVSFFSNTANIPSMSLQIATQPTYLKNIPQPGNKIDFEDFSFRFLVDEDFVNYMEIYNWIKGLGYPESLEQIYKLQEQDQRIATRINSAMNIYSDATLFVLNSNQRTNFQVRFYDLFPYDLTTLLFDATVTDANPFTAEVKFKYTYFEVTDTRGDKLYEYKY